MAPAEHVLSRPAADAAATPGTLPNALASASSDGRATAGLPTPRPWESLLPRPLRGDTGGQVLLALLTGVVLLVAILNLAVPASSALHLSTYAVTLIGKYLTYALLAIAVDLVWGYCGILSLGHAAFFALGGDAMGMYFMRQIGKRGVDGNPDRKRVG